jgi:hypothetical protein
MKQRGHWGILHAAVEGCGRLHYWPAGGQDGRQTLPARAGEIFIPFAGLSGYSNLQSLCNLPNGDNNDTANSPGLSATTAQLTQCDAVEKVSR